METKVCKHKIRLQGVQQSKRPLFLGLVSTLILYTSSHSSASSFSFKNSQSPSCNKRQDQIIIYLSGELVIVELAYWFIVIPLYLVG